MTAEPAPSTTCPVFFCGTPTRSVGFDTFCSNAQKISSIGAQQILVLGQVLDKIKDLEHGVLVVLLNNKNDLVTVLNILGTCKKRIDKGVMRVVVYCLMDHEKIPALLKQKGCCENLADGLTQKALVHKLQKHIQIVETKFKTFRHAKSDEVQTFKKEGRNSPASRAAAEKGKLKFIPAVENENDCWLVKSKKDFKYVRGMWMGEMVGPGPSAGSWTEAGGTGAQMVFQWVPRAQSDVFVPGKGNWYSVGKKPEFVWKTNRWLFIGDTPSLFFKSTDTGVSTYRFKSGGTGSLEVSINSTIAKNKLQAIIKTFDEEKLFKEEKKKAGPDKDLHLASEKKRARGDVGESLSPDDDPKEWGELDPGEEEVAPDWNDEQDEELDPLDWNGTDIGKGNKFNSGRGLGAGQGGAKGYAYEEDAVFEKEAEAAGWKKGAEAFESIQLLVTVCRMDVPGTPVLDDIAVLERQGNDLLLDAPALSFLNGEKLSFSVILGHSGKRRNLEMEGAIKNVEVPDTDGRAIIMVAIGVASQVYLTEIQNTFDLRQEQLLRFLREAKGNG